MSLCVTGAIIYMALSVTGIRIVAANVFVDVMVGAGGCGRGLWRLGVVTVIIMVVADMVVA